MTYSYRNLVVYISELPRDCVTLSRGCSESVVLPLPNEAMLPRSIFSRLPSSDAVSSNSLRIKVENLVKYYIYETKPKGPKHTMSLLYTKRVTFKIKDLEFH